MHAPSVMFACPPLGTPIIAKYAGVVVTASLLIGIGMWVGSVNTDIRNFREFMDEMRGKIYEILERLPDSEQ